MLAPWRPVRHELLLLNVSAATAVWGQSNAALSLPSLAPKLGQERFEPGLSQPTPVAGMCSRAQGRQNSSRPWWGAGLLRAPPPPGHQPAPPVPPSAAWAEAVRSRRALVAEGNTSRVISTVRINSAELELAEPRASEA